MTNTVINTVIEGAKLAFAVIGGGFALYTYWVNARTRRAEWLLSLYAKFYEPDRFRKTRTLLDYETKEFEELKKCVATGTCSSEAQDLDDYLNFFEFVANLLELRQIRKEEVHALFDYYIRSIAKHEFLREHLRYSYEHLTELIRTWECDR